MTAKENARRFARELWTSTGLEGWIIYDGPSTWYGPYASRFQARARLGKRDSLDMKIEGVVVPVGRDHR